MLRAAEVGTEKARVHIQNHYQRQLGKVVPLGQHLGADHDGGFAFLDLRQMCIQGAFAAGGIPVDANHRHRQGLFQQFGKLFGAAAGFLDGAGAAVRAAAGDALLVAAVMTAQGAVAAMPGKKAVAAFAFRLPAAVVAENHRRVAAPVDEHQSLITGLHTLFQCLQRQGQ